MRGWIRQSASIGTGSRGASRQLVHSIWRTRRPSSRRSRVSAPGSTVGTSVDVDLKGLDRIDGAGAVLLARLLDRLDADGRRTRVVEDSNPEAARLIAFYRARAYGTPADQARSEDQARQDRRQAAGLPTTVTDALDFTGRFAAAVPKDRRGTGLGRLALAADG